MSENTTTIVGRPFKPGFDPRRNLKGRAPNGGTTLTEAYNELGDAVKYPDDQLESISKGHENRFWRYAADLHIRLRKSKGQFSKAGIPLVANDLDRIHDRTVGKPAQHVHVVQEKLPTLAEAEHALAEALKTCPPEQLAAAIEALPADEQRALLEQAAPKTVVNEASGSRPRSD